MAERGGSTSRGGGGGDGLCLGAGFGKSGSPWTSPASTYITCDKVLH